MRQYRQILTNVCLGLLLCQFLTGCVTETSDRLAQNRDPEKATKIYVEAGLRYMQINQIPNADRTLKRAYELSPNDASVNNALGLLYKLEEDAEQAEKHFKKALSSDPNFSQARNNYAAFLFEYERYDAAISQLERVTKDYSYPRRYTAYENLGTCYLKLGDKDNAKIAFNRALQLNANLSTSLLEMAELSFEEGSHGQASRYLERYEGIAPPSARQLWLGIRLQRILGNKDKLGSYELALKNMFPGSAEYKAYSASKTLL